MYNPTTQAQMRSNSSSKQQHNGSVETEPLNFNLGCRQSRISTQTLLSRPLPSKFLARPELPAEVSDAAYPDYDTMIHPVDTVT
jgi:hypothetical protein